MALTVDEYGGVTGLVTMEDLLECIFGDLPSPSDKVRKIEYQTLSDGVAQIPGHMPVSAFNREFTGALWADHAETVAGLLLSEHGELPVEGTEIRLGEYVFEVLELRWNRIESILVKRAPAEADTEQASGESTEAAPDAASDRASTPATGKPADPDQKED